MRITYRYSRTEDGKRIWSLIDRIGTLERNTGYYYALFAREFAKTCVVAEHQGELVGFVVGFRPPERPNSVFVWQVGVSPDFRGHRIATGLLVNLLDRTGADHLEATVSEDNTASCALFRGLGRKLNIPCRTEACFESQHFVEDHEPEELFRIGPVSARSALLEEWVDRFTWLEADSPRDAVAARR